MARSEMQKHRFLCCLALPVAGDVIGMGIQKGVTLIVGGGFHGKSTLLQATQLSILDRACGLSGPQETRIMTCSKLALGSLAP